MLTSEPKLDQLRTSLFDSLTFSEKILRFIIDEKICGLTFLCFCATGESMLFILNVFISSGIVPKIINKNSTILLIDVPDLKLRFLNLVNFLPYTRLNEIPNIPFFPEHFLCKETLQSNLIPYKNMFFCYLDTIEVRNKKEAFYDSLDLENWCYKTRAMQYCSKVINALIQQTYIFIEGARSFQERAFAYYGMDFRFIHPFADNVSRNGYVFHLFQFLDFNNRDIYTISREYSGVADRVSKPEMEWVQFLEFKNPSAKMIHAWSPYGQKRFNATVPDCLDESNGIAYFFMGCYYHSHSSKVCPLNKKCSEEKSNQKMQEFNAKIEKLKEENEAIKTIVIKWECEWKIEKKSGEVAFFINNKFIEKPRRRLIPRDSCEHYFPLLTALAVFFAFPSCRTSLRPT